MSKYTVRVELHDADEDDYVKLHAAMERKGFVRWIKDGSGKKFGLPTAEYNMIIANLDKANVLNRARAAANSVKPKPEPWIIVTTSNGRTWSGLVAWRD